MTAVKRGVGEAKPAKSAQAFRTISEVAEELDVAQHVLRFWESKFAQVRPLKRAGGRRYYRPEDVETLRLIHRLLYGEGYTIKGAQKHLKDHKRGEAGPANGNVVALADNPETGPWGERLRRLRAELVAIRDELREA